MIQYRKRGDLMIYHNIPPVFDENSTVLILGSFPSVKSREAQFFYNHPQNRFWKVLSAVFSCECPVTIPQKKAFLLENRVAVWDVIASCEIHGSSDSSIRNAVPNDIIPVIENSKIRRIFTNGATSYALYNRFLKNATRTDAVKLPSTSPANAAYSLERLIEEWKQITDNSALIK